MKKRIATLGALFAFCFANAQQKEVEQELSTSKGIQFEKGNMFVEGSIKIDTGGQTDFYAFSPKFGYFLNDKLAIGGKLNFSSNEVKADDSKTNVAAIGGFARYYFLQLDSKRFKAYAEAGLGYGRNRIETPVLDDTNNSLTADVTVGLNYFITRNIAATFTLANVLSYNSVSPEKGPSSNTFQLNVNLFENIFDQPQFGLLYKF